MGNDTSTAYATRVPPDIAKLLAQARDETQLTNAELLRLALYHFIRTNPKNYQAFTTAPHDLRGLDGIYPVTDPEGRGPLTDRI